MRQEDLNPSAVHGLPSVALEADALQSQPSFNSRKIVLQVVRRHETSRRLFACASTMRTFHTIGRFFSGAATVVLYTASIVVALGAAAHTVTPMVACGLLIAAIGCVVSARHWIRRNFPSQPVQDHHANTRGAAQARRYAQNCAPSQAQGAAVKPRRSVF